MKVMSFYNIMINIYLSLNPDVYYELSFYDIWYGITEGYIISKTPSIPIHLHNFGFELHTDRLTLSTRLKNDAGRINDTIQAFHEAINL